MEPNESFVFFRSYIESVLDCDEETQKTLALAIIKYALYGIEPNLTGVNKAVFIVARPSIDSSIMNYKYGKKGGRPRKNKGDSEKGKPDIEEEKKDGLQETKTGVFEDKEIVDKKGGSEKSKTTKALTTTMAMTETKDETMTSTRTSPNSLTGKTSGKKKPKDPTLDEVIEYARSRGREDLAERFFDYYDISDWHDKSGAKILNWKQKFITWEQKNPKPEKKKKAKDDLPDWYDDSLYLNGRLND